MSHTPKISVILPVYNSRFTLVKAIESVLSQSFTEFEFIIVDDQSSDGSGEVVRYYATMDSRIVAVYHSKNLGLVRTLNEMIHLSRSDLVVRMDHDDESLPDRLQRQFEFMSANPDISASGTFVYHMGRKERFDKLVKLPEPDSEIRQTLQKYNCLYHPSVIFRKSAIIAVGGYRTAFKNAEDYDLWLRVSAVGMLANIPIPLLRYRFSVGGMTLKNKWDQYFYHHLAQISAANPDTPLDELREQASNRRDADGKAYFLSAVYQGTCNELLDLHHYTSALRLCREAYRDVGLKFTLNQFFSILRRVYADLCCHAGL